MLDISTMTLKEVKRELKKGKEILKEGEQELERLANTPGVPPSLLMELVLGLSLVAEIREALKERKAELKAA